MARLNDALRDAIREDLRRTNGTSEGSLRNIAERHGVSATTVRRLRAELNLSSSAARAKTKNATEALRSDLAARRARISERLVEAAERALDDMVSPATIFNFGGKDNTYNSKVVSKPPVGDQRQLATIAAIALDKHKMLDGYDASQHLASSVDDWLGAMMGRRGQEGGTT